MQNKYGFIVMIALSWPLLKEGKLALHMGGVIIPQEELVCDLGIHLYIELPLEISQKLQLVQNIQNE